MEAFEMDNFGEAFEMERAMPEETSFFENAFNEFDNFDEFDEFDDFDKYDNNIDLDGRTDLRPFNPDEWIQEYKKNVEKEENTIQDKRKRWESAQKRRIVKTRKMFFRNNLDQEVVMRDGPASRKLVERSLISVSSKTGKVNGVEFDGVRVVVRKGNDFVLSGNEKIKGAVLEYNNILKEARLEHSKTANATIEEAVGDLPGTSNVNGIRANIIDKIQDKIIINDNAVDRTQLTDEELRELGGILATNKVENLDAVDIAVEYWDDKAKAEKDIRKKAVFKDISDVAKLKAEEIRLKNNLKPTGEKTLEMIESDEITKYEKQQ